MADDGAAAEACVLGAAMADGDGDAAPKASVLGAARADDGAAAGASVLGVAQADDDAAAGASVHGAAAKASVLEAKISVGLLLTDAVVRATLGSPAAPRCCPKMPPLLSGSQTGYNIRSHFRHPVHSSFYAEHHIWKVV